MNEENLGGDKNPAALQLNLLGPLQVLWQNGIAPRFRSHKASALLGYLAAEARPVSRAAITTLFWPDQTDTVARRELRRVLHNLSALLPGCIHAERQLINFKTPPECQIDIVTFTQLQAKGDLDALRKAYDLYKGPFMEGVFLVDCIDFENWLLGKREIWQQRAIHVLEQLIDHYSNQGAYVDGLDYAQQLVALVPWHEEGHRQIMLLAARNGRRNNALTQYDLCRQILAKELDVEPSDETSALYRRLKTAVLPPPHHLPLQATPFIGREAELAQIQQLLVNPSCRLINILGTGGMGKTRLALQAGLATVNQQALLFLHGVAFVPLADLDTPSLLVPAIANALRFDFHGSQTPEDQLFNYLQEKEMLLILDNYEHLLPHIDLLPQLLSECPDIKLIVTSRERLSLQEEWCFDISGLPYPELLSIRKGDLLEQESKLQNFSAVTLFAHIAQRGQREFSLDIAATAVIQICQLVEGMPLALELAAASVRTMNCAAIACEIEQNLQLLQTPLSNVPERHRSIQAVFEHSWQRLSPEEQHIFQQLAIFRGSFSINAAEKVTAVTSKVLALLQGKSLIRQIEPDRYEIHELLRRFTIAKLSQDVPRLAATFKQHSTYFAKFLQQQEHYLKADKQIQALQEIDKDIQNIRLAWQQLLEAKRFNRLNDCLNGIFLYYDLRGRHKEGEALLQSVLSTTQIAPPTFQARLKIRLARFVGRQTRYDEALTLLHESKAVFQAADLPQETALSLYLIGVVERQKGAYKSAKLALQESLALYQALNDHWETARTLNILSDAVRHFGNYQMARKYGQQSLAIFTQLDDKWGRAIAMHTLGLIEYEIGDFKMAQNYYRKSLAIKQEIGDKWGTATLFNSLGIVNFDLGHYDEAELFYEESLALAQELGSWERVAATMNNLGLVANKQKAHNKARQNYQQCLAICRQIGDQRGEAVALTNLGETAIALETYTEAQEYLEESLRLKRAMNFTRGTAYALIYLGDISLIQGDYDQAKIYYRDALSLTFNIGAIPRILDVIVHVASLLRVTSYQEQAIELLAFVLNRSDYDNSTAERAAQLLAELATEIAPASFSAAQDRGKAMQLETAVDKILTDWLPTDQ